LKRHKSGLAASAITWQVAVGMP